MLNWFDWTLALELDCSSSWVIVKKVLFYIFIKLLVSAYLLHFSVCIHTMYVVWLVIINILIPKWKFYLSVRSQIYNVTTCIHVEVKTMMVRQTLWLFNFRQTEDTVAAQIRGVATYIVERAFEWRSLAAKWMYMYIDGANINNSLIKDFSGTTQNRVVCHISTIFTLTVPSLRSVLLCRTRVWDRKKRLATCYMQTRK